MPTKNIKGLLIDATKYPAAIEAKLPAGAPKISTMLLNAANQIPTVPDFPMEVPDLPAVPALPAMPGQTAAGLTKYVTAVEVVPVKSPVTPLVQSYTQPIEGVVGTVMSRRGM
jgi:hypothetical protein